jgi:hypothetical protein
MTEENMLLANMYPRSLNHQSSQKYGIEIALFSTSSQVSTLYGIETRSRVITNQMKSLLEKGERIWPIEEEFKEWDGEEIK